MLRLCAPCTMQAGKEEVKFGLVFAVAMEIFEHFLPQESHFLLYFVGTIILNRFGAFNGGSF